MSCWQWGHQWTKTLKIQTSSLSAPQDSMAWNSAASTFTTAVSTRFPSVSVSSS